MCITLLLIDKQYMYFVVCLSSRLASQLAMSKQYQDFHEQIIRHMLCHPHFLLCCCYIYYGH